MKASPTKPWVCAFAERMENKLRANRHKGDRGGWSKAQVSWLLRSLLWEVGELADEIGKKGVPTAGEPARRRARIAAECADVANFAMMIADRAGDLADDVPPASGGKEAKP